MFFNLHFYSKYRNTFLSKVCYRFFFRTLLMRNKYCLNQVISYCVRSTFSSIAQAPEISAALKFCDLVALSSDLRSERPLECWSLGFLLRVIWLLQSKHSASLQTFFDCLCCVYFQPGILLGFQGEVFAQVVTARQLTGSWSLKRTHGLVAKAFYISLLYYIYLS